MKKVSRTALLPYSAKKVYDLVNDIESYPSFLPWCAKAEILQQSGNEMYASITIAKAGIKKSFTTVNQLHDGQYIAITLVDGPFKSLTGRWDFKSLDKDACKILFEMEFEANNSILGITIAHIFEQIVATFVDSFCKRAKQIYG